MAAHTIIINTKLTHFELQKPLSPDEDRLQLDN